MYVPRKSGRAALDEVDEVDWTTLEHAYTGAENVGDHDPPLDDFAGMLRTFFGDEEEREHGYDAFLSVAVHQGTLYAVTGHLVPFFAAFSAGEDDHAADSALCCLVHATGGALSALGTPEADSVFEALLASRHWLEKVQDRLGVVNFLLEAASSRNAELVDEVDELIEAMEPPPPPPPEPKSVSREEASAFLRSPGALDAHAIVTFGWRVLHSGHADLAAQIAEPHRKGRMRTWAELLIGEALSRQDAIEEARHMAFAIAEEWLAPPTGPDSANQVVQRHELGGFLERFQDEQSKALHRRLMAAAEPDIYVPPGDFF